MTDNWLMGTCGTCSGEQKQELPENDNQHQEEDAPKTAAADPHKAHTAPIAAAIDDAIDDAIADAIADAIDDAIAATH